jgi:hypothetical protein
MNIADRFTAYKYESPCDNEGDAVCGDYARALILAGAGAVSSGRRGGKLLQLAGLEQIDSGEQIRPSMRFFKKRSINKANNLTE